MFVHGTGISSMMAGRGVLTLSHVMHGSLQIKPECYNIEISYLRRSSSLVALEFFFQDQDSFTSF